MVPGVNIISGKAGILGINGAGGPGGALSPSTGVLAGGAPLRKFLGSKEQESPRESAAGVMRIYIYENTPKKLPHSTPKSCRNFT